MTNEDKPHVQEEPEAADGISARVRMISSTLLVDEFFDELIDKVHRDYANLYKKTSSETF